LKVSAEIDFMLRLSLRIGLLIAGWSILPISTFAQNEPRQKNPTYYFEKGEEALKNKSYKTALAHFNECLRQNPYFTDAYFSRAITREFLGDKQGALTDYNIYLESKPEDKEALFSRAVSRYDFGQWAVAKEDFLKLLSMPSGGETNTVYFQTNQSADGVTKAFTVHHHLKGTVLNYLGLIETKLKNYNEAERYFNTAIELSSNEADYYLNRGIALLSAGDTSRALADFKTVLRINPESSLARHNLAVLKESDSTSNDAEQLLTEAIEKNPSQPHSFAERGYLRMQKGDLKGALEDYNEAIRLGANDPDYWLNRGMVKEQSKDLTGALEDFRQVITLKPDYEKGWLSHGNVLVKLKRIDEAIEDYTVAITYYPEYGLAFYNRGLTLHQQGKKAEACRDLEKAKQLGVKVDAKAMNAICNKK
jgi:tetratricopeptide (TPR) repeat protein